MAKELAVVTGASSGIGLSLAKQLADSGYDLVICSAGDRLASVGNSLQDEGTQVTSIQADLATREGVEHLWQGIKALGRPIAIACINAGVGVGDCSPKRVSMKNSTWWNSTAQVPSTLQNT